MEQFEQGPTDVDRLDAHPGASGLLHSVPHSDATLLELPFTDVSQAQVHELYGFKGYWYCYVDRKRRIQGNFVANSISREIRTNARKLYGKTKRPDLQYIFRLPLELVMEIFASLHPMDLYHLTQTSKEIRRILLDPRAAYIWTRSFGDNPSVPPVEYGDISAPKWATMLFSPIICEKCHERWGVVDFAFGIDLCVECLDFDTVTLSSFYKTLKTLLPLARHYILSKLFTPRIRKRVSVSNNSYAGEYVEMRVHRSDVEHLLTQCKEHVAAIREGVPGSVSRYDTFISEIKEPKDYKKILHSVSSWRDHHYRKCQSHRDNEMEHILNKFLKILIRIGYEPEDVNLVNENYAGLRIMELHGIRKANRRSFNRCRKDLERLVLQVEDERMAFERGSY